VDPEATGRDARVTVIPDFLQQHRAAGVAGLRM
jgi:hypothetical protein